MSYEPHSNGFPDFSELFLWNLTPSDNSRTGFHMPGHVNARSFDAEYSRRLLLTDTTELSRTDDLHGPGGPVLRAAERLAHTYGSGRSFFITTGSTTGIRVMMAAVCCRNSFFLIPRAVHVSVLYTFAILGTPYAFFPSHLEQESPDDPIRRITPEDVTEGLQAYPQTTDVLLVSPDYYGSCADLRAIAGIVHSKGARLLVDEAHGAHLRFCPEGAPKDAMDSGADISVMSLHKTMPALTMSSLLHISAESISSGRVDPDAILSMLRVFETSSPSFLIAASAEYAVAWAREEGRARIAAVIEEKTLCLHSIAQSRLLSGLFRSDYRDQWKDPLRMLIHLHDDAPSGIAISKALEQRGVDIEMADLRRLVLIVSPWHQKEDFDRFIAALEDVAGHLAEVPGCLPASAGDSSVCEAWSPEENGRASHDSVCEVDRMLSRCLTNPAESLTDVRNAFFVRPKESVRYCASEGREAGVPVVSYPPGIPLLWPGERIGAEHISCISNLIAQGITVTGLTAGEISVLSCEKANGTEASVRI